MQADWLIECTATLEAIRDYGLTDDFAMCSGNCSCATCHVIITEAYLPKLPPLSDEEDDVLDSSDERQDGSRLSCQVPLSSDLNGMLLRIVDLS